MYFFYLTFLLLFFSIFTEERLERLTKGINLLDLESPEDYMKEESSEENTEETSDSDDRAAEDMVNGTEEFSQLGDSTHGRVTDDGSHLEHQLLDGDTHLVKKGINSDDILPADHENETQIVTARRESGTANAENCDVYVDEFVTNKQALERRFPNAVLPLLRHYQYESSESSSR